MESTACYGVSKNALYNIPGFTISIIDQAMVLMCRSDIIIKEDNLDIFSSAQLSLLPCYSIQREFASLLMNNILHIYSLPVKGGRKHIRVQFVNCSANSLKFAFIYIIYNHDNITAICITITIIRMYINNKLLFNMKMMLKC